MNRRDFLRRLGIGTSALAAAAVFDPELALWVPGQKTFFLPSPVLVIPNQFEDAVYSTFLTPEWITREALRVLENDLTFARGINRQYDETYPVGGTIAIRTPARYAIR